MGNNDITISQELLNKIVEVGKYNVTGIENTIHRVDNIENLLSQVRYIVNGNGQPGLAENLRSMKVELDNLKDDIREINQTFNVDLGLLKSALELELKKQVDSNSHRIDGFEKDVKTFKWVLSVIGSTMLVLIVRALWGILFIK